MLTHLYFDIETLGLREDTVVLSLACVPFTFEGDETYVDLLKVGFYVKFDAQNQLHEYNRTKTKSTLDFWAAQSEEAKQLNLKPSNDDMMMVDGLGALTTFIEKSKYNKKNSYVWSRGNYFDFPKIEHMYFQIGIESEDLPFNNWKIRDSRTMIDVLTGSTNGAYNLKAGEPSQFIKHHALHDACIDICRMKEIYKSLL